MKPTAISILLLFASTSATAGPVADFIQRAHREAWPSQPAAQQSFETLKKLATSEETGKRLGLWGKQIATDAAVEKLQPIYEVGLDTIRNYRPAEDLTGIQPLRDAGRVLFLENTASPAYSVEVQQMSPGEWVTLETGQPDYTALLRATLSELQKQPRDTIIVEIPAFQLRFIGFAANAGNKEILMLASVTDAPELGIQKAVARPASVVLLSLIDAAKRHNGLPT